MKFSTSFLLTASLIIPPGLAELVLSNLFRQSPIQIAPRCQEPIMNIPNILFPPSKGDDDNTPGGSDSLSISDVIGKERVINIFAGFTRDIDSISKRFNDSSANTTVLAPLNSAMQKLPRKPWEDPEDYSAMGEQAYEGTSGEDRAQRNLRRFAEAHIVPISPWKEGEKVETIGGGKIWWESKDANKLVQPGDIEVSSIASRVSNGEVWIVKECLNYA